MTSGRTQVALAIDTLDRGGAERVLVAIANHLDRSRFGVHVITTRAAGPLASELAGDVRVHSLGRRSRLDVGAFRRLHELLVREGITLVHSHSHTTAYLVRLTRQWYRTPMAHVLHDHHGPVMDKPLMRALDRLLLRDLDHHIAVSAELGRHGANLGVPAERRSVVPNGVAIPPRAAAGAAETFTVVQLARVVDVKDQLLAIDVADRLHGNVSTLRWLLVGKATSDYADECRAEIERRGLGKVVALLGERSDVSPLLEDAHVGVLTSRREGLPVALLEYMAAGLPVVVTDVGQCATIVRTANGGEVVPSGDAASFAAAVARLAADAELRSELGARGRDYVSEHHGIAAQCRAVEDIYVRTIPPRATRRNVMATA